MIYHQLAPAPLKIDPLADSATNSYVTGCVHSYGLARMWLLPEPLRRQREMGGWAVFAGACTMNPVNLLRGRLLRTSWIRQLYSHPHPIQGSQARGRLGAICREEGITTSPLGETGSGSRGDPIRCTYNRAHTIRIRGLLGVGWHSTTWVSTSPLGAVV